MVKLLLALYFLVSSGFAISGADYRSVPIGFEGWSIFPYVGNYDKPGHVGYLVKNESGKWEYAENANLQNDNAERIRIHVPSKRIYLDAPHLNRDGNLQVVKNGERDYTFSTSETTGCKFTARDVFYHICGSNFAKTITPDALQATVSVITTLLGVPTWGVRVDEEAFVNAIRESGVFTVIQALNEKHDIEMKEMALAKYRKEFRQASTASDFKQFANKYALDDPDSLVKIALEKEAELLKEEAALRNKEAEEARQRELAEAARLAAQKKEEDALRKRLLVDANNFRRAIKVESETNCGPVLEVKGSLVKIYSPVQGYGNEHWIRRDEIFPPRYSCSFFNGRYDPPRL